MTNTDTPQQQAVATDLRSLGIRPVPCGLSGFMVAGCYVSLSEAQTMVARYRRAAARRAQLNTCAHGAVFAVCLPCADVTR